MPDEIGDCMCPCGQEYRFANGAEGLWLWPRCGAHAYRREPLAEPRCIRCGADLAERLQAVGAAADT